MEGGCPASLLQSHPSLVMALPMCFQTPFTPLSFTALDTLWQGQRRGTGMLRRGLRPSLRPGAGTGWSGTEVSRLSCHMSDNKYFRFCGQCGLCHNCLPLPLHLMSSHRQYINEWAWLCSNKALLTKIGNMSDSVHRPWFACIWSRSWG